MDKWEKLAYSLKAENGIMRAALESIQRASEGEMATWTDACPRINHIAQTALLQAARPPQEPTRWQLWVNSYNGPEILAETTALTFDDAVNQYLSTLPADRQARYSKICCTTPGSEITHHFYRGHLIVDNQEAARKLH